MVDVFVSNTFSDSARVHVLEYDSRVAGDDCLVLRKVKCANSNLTDFLVSRWFEVVRGYDGSEGCAVSLALRCHLLNPCDNFVLIDGKGCIFYVSNKGDVHVRARRY